MVSKAFQKGFIDGFLSPFTFFMPPEKRRRELKELPAYLEKEIEPKALEKAVEDIKLIIKSKTSMQKDALLYKIYAYMKLNTDATDYYILTLKNFQDVSVDGAWEEVGRNLSKAMEIEAEGIHAGEQPKKQKAAGKE